MDIKDLIIFLVIFISVLWLQHNDDKKFDKPQRTTIYDKIKLPLFMSLAIILIKNLYTNKSSTNNNFLELFISSEPDINVKTDFNPTFNSTNKFIKPSYVNFNQVFTDPPDF
jgi:hypothetical protein